MIFSKRNDIHIISYINIRNNYSFFVFSSIYFFFSMKFKFSSSQKKGILHFSSPIIYHKVLEEKFKTVCHESKKTHFSRDMKCLFMVYSTDRASQYRSIIIDMLIILPLFLLLAGWSFFLENVENCREIKGGWFHLSKRKRCL